MGSKIGVLKIAAGRIGLPFEEYQEKLAQGLKWCWKCRTWKSTSAFSKNARKGDGLCSICKNCSYERKTQGPSKPERQTARSKGLAWCSGCHQWLPFASVRSGKCRSCHAAYERKRYATNKKYRLERRQHAHARKRNVAPIPTEIQIMLLEDSAGKCVYCGRTADTWDHIIPISRGGETTPGNIVPCCGHCNSSKGTRDVLDWIDEKGLCPSSMLCERMELSAME